MLVLALMLSASALYAYEQGRTYKLRIFFMNDTHGRFYSNADGEGGFSAVATQLNNLRVEGMDKGFYPVFLVAGDINTGLPESDLLKAEPDFTALNYLNVDALTLGNHEFDNDPSVLADQIELSKFPMISANIYKKGTNTHAFTPYVQRVYNGLYVTILGLTTEDTPLLTHPDNTKDLTFKPAVETAKGLVPGLKKKTDMLIVLSHLGFYADESHGTNAPGDVTLARQVPGIDVIIGAHSHTALQAPVREYSTLIAQAGEYTKYLGKMDVEFIDGNTYLLDYKLYPINLKKKETVGDQKVVTFIGNPITEDPVLLATVNQFKAKGDESLNQKVGSTDGVFVGDRELVRSTETNLGNLIAAAMAKSVGADLAVMNSGGVRASLPMGDITYRDVLTVQPFGNTIVKTTLTGAELKAYLAVVAMKTPGSGGFPQFWGVNIEVTGDALTSVTVNGKMVDDNAKYTIATNNFVAAGGDGYPKLLGNPSFVDSGLVDATVLNSFIADQGTVKIADFAPKGSFIKK